MEDSSAGGMEDRRAGSWDGSIANGLERLAVLEEDDGAAVVDAVVVSAADTGSFIILRNSA
jgi:hypothetical protein